VTPFCLAQDYHSCTLNAGSGWTQLEGIEKQNFYAGWKNFQAGAGLAVTPKPSSNRSWTAFLTVDYLFDQLDIKPEALQQARILNPTNIGLLEATAGTAKVDLTTLDLNFRVPIKRPVAVYGFGGFGWLRRDLDITGASGEGALLQPGGPAVFGGGGNSGAFDVGAGINIRIPGARGLMFYVEGRVVHGLAVNHETTLLPFSAGIRW